MPPPLSEYYEFGPYRFVPNQVMIWRNEEAVELTSKESDLLLMLVKHSTNLVNKYDLISTVWPDTAATENNLSQLVFQVNEKLGEDVNGQRYIKVKKGHGYRFNVEVKWIPSTEKDAGTTDTPDEIGNKISVGCFPYPPLMDWHPGQNPEYEGPWITLIEKLSGRMKFGLDLRVISASSFMDTKSIKADLVLGLFKTDYRARFFDFSEPMYYIGLQGVCKAVVPKISRERLIQGDLKIVVQQGEVGWEYVMREFKRAYKNKNVFPVSKIATHDVLNELLTKDFAIAIADEVSCMHFLQGIGVGHPFELAFERPLDTYQCCLAVKKSLNWNLEEINRHLIEIRNTSSFVEYEAQCLRNFEHVILTSNRY